MKTQTKERDTSRSLKERIKTKEIRPIYIIISCLLVIIGTTAALLQPPHPDAYRIPGFGDAVFYPIEFNAPQRLPYIDAVLRDSFFLPGRNCQLGWAVGGNGAIVKTTDTGKSWISLESGTHRNLNSVFFIDEQKGWIVGDKGVILFTQDGGTSWNPQGSGITEDIYTIIFSLDGQTGRAFAKETYYKTNDSGKTWEKTSMKLPRIYFERGIQFTGDEIDSLLSFFSQEISDFPRNLIPTDQFRVDNKNKDKSPSDAQVAFFEKNLQRAWALSSYEKIYKITINGKRNELNWEETTALNDRGPIEVDYLILDSPFLQKNAGWAIKIIRQKEQVTVDLCTFIESYFTPPGVTYIGIEEQGNLIKTDDSGRNWFRVNRRPESMIATAKNTGENNKSSSNSKGKEEKTPVKKGKYWRFPALWYCLVLGVALLLLFPAFRDDSDGSELKQSVEAILVSDKPVEKGETDYLDFSPLARGISRFLRNRNTKPPLTLAITGEWGTGKSSLMNMVKHDLQKNHFYPVWFNAWHHQDEDQLLASLLENIRLQGIPPFWRLKGLRFRARLFLQRFKRFVPILFVLLLVYVVLAGFLFAGGSAADMPSQSLINKWPGLGFLLNTAVLVLAFFKKLKPFGSDFNSIIKNLSGSFNIRDLKKDTGFRYKFAQEFKEVTKALHPYNLVILIDDLDRCKPTHVTHILESVNFLVSSGDCFIIMGLAMERVEGCVANEFKDVAEVLVSDTQVELPGEQAEEMETTGKEKNKSLCFARDYLRKLFNIEIPVPRSTGKQLENMLTSKEDEKTGVKRKFSTGLIEFFYHHSRKIGYIFVMVLILSLFAFVAYQLGDNIKVKQNPAETPSQTTIDTGTATGKPDQEKNNTPPAITYQEPVTMQGPKEEFKKEKGQTKINPGEQDWVHYEFYLLSFGLLLALFFFTALDVLPAVAALPLLCISGQMSMRIRHNESTWCESIRCRQRCHLDFPAELRPLPGVIFLSDLKTDWHSASRVQDR